jgi:hypothetical protein
MQEFTNTKHAKDGATSGAAMPAPLTPNALDAPGLWHRIQRFERCDWEVLALAHDLAGASETVRAAIQGRCQAARAEYESEGASG